MKRGSIEKETFLPLELLLGIAVAAILIYTATHIEEFSNVDVMYTESDLDLLASAVSASPGKITYQYEVPGSYQVESTQPFDINKDIISTKEDYAITIES
jgi:hypothetical protein